MKSTIIEGIPDSKIKRLKKHLLKVEEVSGGELRKTPRHERWECPIANFEPVAYTKERREITCGVSNFRTLTMQFIKVYDSKDTDWWEGLPALTRYVITRHIQQWIKEGKKL